MKLRFLLLALSLMLAVPLTAQIDVATLTADTKTFIFSDNKNTVKNYIYEQLQAQSSCCGTDRIYLEVKIDPSGYVLDAKTLTGRNECFKQSAVDIVKNIKWDASGFRGPKSVYFEIKPEIECGEGRENAYAPIPIFNNAKLDQNGVPVDYPGSTGVSALEASGTAPTGVPQTPSEEEVAAADAQNNPLNPANQPAAETGEESGAVAANQPASQTPATTATPTRGEAAPPAGQATTSDEQLAEAKRRAEMRAEEQAAEAERLRQELAEAKAREEERKKQEQAEAEARAEQERLAAQQNQREEMERRRQERLNRDNSRDSDPYGDDNPYAVRDEDRSNSRDSRDPYQDRRYDNDRDRGSNRYDDDRGSRGYDDRRDTDPPASAVDREREKKREIDSKIADLERQLSDIERDEQRRQSDAERLRQDLIRERERQLRQEAAIAAAEEKERLDRLEEERRRKEEERLAMQREVQQLTDELKRQQLDLERKLADLQRREQEVQETEQQKQALEQEIAANAAQREARIEGEIDNMKRTGGVNTGGFDPGAPVGPAPVFSGNDSSGNSAAMQYLIAQINAIQAQIQLLNNQLGVTTPVSTSRSATPTRSVASSRAPQSVPGNASAPRSPLSDPGILKVDYRNEENKDAEIYRAFGANTSPARGGIGPANHANLPGPNMERPVYPGGVEAMKENLTEQLRESQVCGLVDASFELIVNPSGAVVGYRILRINSANAQVAVGTALSNLQFQALNTPINSRAVYNINMNVNCN